MIYLRTIADAYPQIHNSFPAGAYCFSKRELIPMLVLQCAEVAFMPDPNDSTAVYYIKNRFAEDLSESEITFLILQSKFVK